MVKRKGNKQLLKVLTELETQPEFKSLFSQGVMSLYDVIIKIENQDFKYEEEVFHQLEFVLKVYKKISLYSQVVHKMEKILFKSYKKPTFSLRKYSKSYQQEQSLFEELKEIIELRNYLEQQIKQLGMKGIEKIIECFPYVISKFNYEEFVLDLERLRREDLQKLNQEFQKMINSTK